MNKVTKILGIVLALALMAAMLVGCAPAASAAPAENEPTAAPAADEPTAAPAEEQTGTVLAKVLEAGVLKLGTSADYPPYEFHTVIDGADTIVGFDIALGKAIADHLGVKFEIVDMDFDGLVSALQTGNVDIVIAGMSPTPERTAAVDFSQVYYKAAQAALILATDAQTITSIEDLNGLPAGAQLGAIQAGILEDQFPDSAPTLLTKIDALVLELLTGKIKGVIMEDAVAKSYDKNYDELVMADFLIPYESDGTAVAVAKGNEDFVAKINELLDTLIPSGGIDQMVADAVLLADSNAE